MRTETRQLPVTPTLEPAMRWDRTRDNLDQHPNYILPGFMA